MGSRERPPRVRFDQPDGSPDDDRAERGLREIPHRLSQEKEHERDTPGADEPGDLRAPSHLIVHSRPRTAGTHGEGLRDTGGGVGDADRGQLLVRPDVLPVLPREGSGREDRVGETDEEDPEGRREEGPDVARVE